MKRDFLSIADWSGDELLQLIRLCRRIKASPGNYAQTFRGKSFALIFEKQSLRTHVTFDVGVHELGGHPIYLTQSDISLGARESIHDTAKNLERWVSGIIVRTFAHKSCADLAKESRVPVINALTDFEHPCQAIGDFQTIFEKFDSVKERKFVWVGDGNNVCHSLMLTAAKLGMNFVACTPKGYEPNSQVVNLACAAAKEIGCAIDVLNAPLEAAKNADVIYTDVWTSMGQEKEKQQRLEIFRPYQVNAKLMGAAKPGAIFMHCLPAHRGEEVTDEVIDSRQSVVFDEAENRLHSAKAVMVTIMPID